MEAIKTYKSNPYLDLGDFRIPTWTTPLVLLFLVTIFIPNTSLLGHLCGMAVGYGCTFPSCCRKLRNADIESGGLGYLKFLAPPEWALRFIEGKMNLLGRLPHYVSVDQKTFGRYGVLPTSSTQGVEMSSPGTFNGSSQRLGPWDYQWDIMGSLLSCIIMLTDRSSLALWGMSIWWITVHISSCSIIINEELY